MAHNPQREDYQRLSLRFARELDAGDPGAATRAYAGFARRFAQDRDGLPQTDADRAFHLVVLATEAIDYQLPFASDEQAQDLIRRGRDLLGEALSLDPSCHDARRMLSSSETPSLEARYRFLADGADQVRASCERARAEQAASFDGERRALAADIAMRPYWRWMASLAEEALICGHNHAAAEAAEALLSSDPRDTSDVRFTLAYALAKLEDESGLAALERRYALISPLRGPDDAWLLLAKVALAHRRLDLGAARRGLARLLDAYPSGALALIRQAELPDGEFARLRVSAGSEDELILAISEGIVLLQEGNDRAGRGALGSWVAGEVSRISPNAAREAARVSRQEGVQRP